jgi:asparagine synthase (glutamine-hydrolysing)
MEFWQEVPLALRKERRWYLEHVKRQYAEQTGAGAAVVLGNSSDINSIARLARSLLKRFPPGTKHHLKALRHVVLPRKVRNDYLVSHMPPLKVLRLQRNGYSPIGMLVEEFLDPGSQQ